MDGWGFEDPITDKEFKEYVYKRNQQLYAALYGKMTYTQAADLFGLSKNSIKTMYKAHRHKYPRFYM